MFISFSFLLFKRFERAGIGAFFAVKFRVSLSRVKFSGFRTVRHRRGITSLGIAAKQRNALFQFIKMGL
jgi:hypothetical protein